MVVKADDARARLLGQALNHMAGSDNLGLRAEVLRDVLESMPQEDVMALLPETAASLQALTSIGKQSIAQALQQWEQAQKARRRGYELQYGVPPSLLSSRNNRSLGHHCFSAGSCLGKIARPAGVGMLDSCAYPRRCLRVIGS